MPFSLPFVLPFLVVPPLRLCKYISKVQPVQFEQMDRKKIGKMQLFYVFLEFVLQVLPGTGLLFLQGGWIEKKIIILWTCMSYDALVPPRLLEC